MSLALFNLAGRRALVTGSSTPRGIGFTIARGLAAAGATVILNARGQERLDSAVELLRAAGHDAHGAAFDVTDPAAVDAAVGEIEAAIGEVDILVNNAGVQLRKPVAEWSPEDWHRVIDTDLTSAWFMSRAFGLRMVARGHGKIINICSMQSELGRTSIVPYTAAKGGLKMMTRGLCAEWASSGVQVNGIAPGYFDTELTSALVSDPKFSAWVEARTPAGRWGNTEELVGAAIFLASDASSFVNGQLLFVDGGMVSVV
jgi:gluconate 5-dehydrogenase